MARAVLTSVARLTVVLALGGVLLPTAAGAKVDCEVGERVTTLPGLPAELQAGRMYALTVDLPQTHAVNPRPLILAQRCAREGGRLFPGGKDFAQFQGAHEGVAGATFDLRLARAGRWHLVSMDVSGHFRDHGFYSVNSAASPAPATGRASLGAVLIAGGGIIVTAGLLLVRMRRRQD